MTKLQVYADRMSQPSRAVLIFCRLNGIDFEEIKVDISKRQQLSPEFREVNPLRKVPAIVHGSFKLSESHAILVYLASAFPGIADHWYPTDLFKRAKINSVLDWHHSNLRHGAVNYAINTVLAPALGLPLNPKAAAEVEKVLLSSLSKLEEIWLNGDGPFLFGGFQPSIADLSLVCEIMQLEVLDEKDRSRILSPYKKVLQWIEDTKTATNPHFEEIHNILYRAKRNSNSSVQGQLKLGLSLAARWGGIQRCESHAFIFVVRHRGTNVRPPDLNCGVIHTAIRRICIVNKIEKSEKKCGCTWHLHLLLLSSLLSK